VEDASFQMQFLPCLRSWGGMGAWGERKGVEAQGWGDLLGDWSQWQPVS
jgi:hypothetical protein